MKSTKIVFRKNISANFFKQFVLHNFLFEDTKDTVSYFNSCEQKK